ncbi:hypothetical protein F7725_011027 [Dissostichus mawsoni]|uniref:Uncharacterized protein n=1 Tax=Dissostichus mawsoni TaxID=36200 RepID=A0A7J5Z833_DISMA|nr:hypothetical protein F7725_011027 [Dissostichus mawsoni]
MCLTERVHGRPMRSFVMVVRVEGGVFEGCGHSKRTAKSQAAAAALQSVYNITLGPERSVMGLNGSRAKLQLPQVFAESIFHLVREKYSELTDVCSSSYAKHKVLAGVVMSRGFDLRTAQVVSLATGTKCLDLDNDSDHSETLSDCHAEVMSRRALVRFLYAQLELLLCKPADCEEQSIFVPNKVGGGFRLQDGVFFHMFVSSSPCGDARLSCPYETTAAYPSRRFHCHLRVKVDGGEGTLPITARRANQNNMAAWGAPLSPGGAGLPAQRHRGNAQPHGSPEPSLCTPPRTRLNSSDVRPSGKAPNVSVNWSRGEEAWRRSAALQDGGKTQGRRHVSAGETFKRCRGDSMDIFGSKMAAGRYQRAMHQFTSALQGGGLGTWLRETPELGHFNVVCEKLCEKTGY